MPAPKAKTLIGIASLLLLLLIAGALFLWYQVRKSFPDTSGTLTIAGIEAPVEIVRDAYGVPTISATSDYDLAFGLGFVHAQDRLWQMDMGRRAASGRLSELFGAETLPVDRLFLTIGLRRTAGQIASWLPDDSRRYLQAYSDGVNASIESRRGAYPVEFDLLRYDPEPWTVLDCILQGRLVAWELNMSWWTDLTMGAIAERVGLERALDIVPTFPKSVAPTVPYPQGARIADLGSEFRDAGRAFHEFTGRALSPTGSNAWVVAPRKSASGRAILANDTHLQLSSPSFWYEVQLQAPGFTAGGMSVPGAPGIVAGRNDSIAWGVTNLMVDDADFYIEQLDSATGTQYLYDGKWYPLMVRTEEIRVRDDTSRQVVIRETRNGPIINSVKTPLQQGAWPYLASMRWVGAEMDDQCGALRLINKATDWRSFSGGVKLFSVPGQNFVYGDSRGNIGYRCGARIPIRGVHHALLPLPGWETSARWRGFVPFDQLPSLYNPREGFIASANNKVAGDQYPYYISDLWEPPSRIQRLREVLGREGEVFSVQDFERLQNDTYSFAARDIVPYIMVAFDSSRVQPEDLPLLEYLRNWGYYFTEDDIATSVFQMFFVRLLNNTFKDEMGDDLFHDWITLSNVPIRVVTRLLEEGTSPWFDDQSTSDTVETRDDVVRRSLREAGRELRSRLGEDSKNWRWGELHRVTFKHPFGLRKPLDRIFNIGPYGVGGGSTSLISGEYSFQEPFDVTVGPSFRQIFDFSSDSDVRVVLPPGESGQIFHSHYDDQMALWLTGGYRIAQRGAAAVHGDRLVLEPRR